MTLPEPHDGAPEADSDPHQVLQEARADAAAGRYADALAKHLWFHANALRYRPSLYEVRLSFALADWLRLGAVYPPALAAFREHRDAAPVAIRDGATDRELFLEFRAFNRTLREEQQTRDLFLWLDAHDPVRAAAWFELALDPLIRFQEYALSGRYVEPDALFEKYRSLYRMKLEAAKDPRFGERMLTFARRSFSKETATLVALLAFNSRPEEAERFAVHALAEWDDPHFRQQLDDAKRGEFPRR
jgi:hypothetical protein